jgi:hypothetical protein
MMTFENSALLALVLISCSLLLPIAVHCDMSPDEQLETCVQILDNELNAILVPDKIKEFVDQVSFRLGDNVLEWRSIKRDDFRIKYIKAWYPVKECDEFILTTDQANARAFGRTECHHLMRQLALDSLQAMGQRPHTKAILEAKTACYAFG